MHFIKKHRQTDPKPEADLRISYRLKVRPEYLNKDSRLDKLGK